MSITKVQAQHTLKAAFLLALGLQTSAAWGIDGSVSADYTTAYVGDDPGLTLAARVQESLPYDLKLSLSQAVIRNQVVDDSKDEWEWADTNIALTHAYKISETAKLSTRLLTTLPLSRDSNHEQLYTRTELRPTLSLELPGNVVSETSAFYSMYFYKYDSTKPEGQTSGGEALGKNSKGFSQGFTYPFLDGFSLGVEGSYREKKYYDLRQTEGFIATENKLIDNGYAVDAFGSYTYREQTTFTVGYSQGSVLEQTGYEDFVVFDKQQSTWNFSLIYIWK